MNPVLEAHLLVKIPDSETFEPLDAKDTRVALAVHPHFLTSAKLRTKELVPGFVATLNPHDKRIEVCVIDKATGEPLPSDNPRNGIPQLFSLRVRHTDKSPIVIANINQDMRLSRTRIAVDAKDLESISTQKELPWGILQLSLRWNSQG